jgi:large subunit ribosomal protein L10
VEDDMSANRDAKVLVVDAVRTKLDEASAAVVTEYRGLTVAEMAALRRALRAVGGDYKVFKNTLVRRAIEGSANAPMDELLAGPTGIAFVSGDVSAVAKALRDFARVAPALIVKGGMLDGALLGAKDLAALADLPSREVLLAQFAGALAAPMRTMANLLQALPQNLAYGLSALLESKGGVRLGSEPEAAPDAEVVASEPEGPAESAVDAEVAVDAEAEASGEASGAASEDEAGDAEAGAQGSTESTDPESDEPAADVEPSGSDDDRA